MSPAGVCILAPELGRFILLSSCPASVENVSFAAGALLASAFDSVWLLSVLCVDGAMLLAYWLDGGG